MEAENYQAHPKGIFISGKSQNISKVHIEVLARKSLTFSQKYILGVTTILYYTCYAPFQFKVQHKSGLLGFQVKTNIVQKVFCILHYICFVGITYFFVCRAFGTDNPLVSQPNLILNAVMVILGTILSLYFTCTVWFYEPSLRLMLETNQAQTTNFVKHKSNFEEKFQNFLAIFYPLFSTVYGCYGMLQWNSVYDPELKNQYINFLLKYLPILFTLFSGFPNVFYICVALTFRDRAHQFIALLQQQMLENYENNLEQIILCEFLALDKYINQLNEHFGIWIMAYSLLTIPFYSLKLTQLCHGTAILPEGIVDLSFFIGTFCFLKLAADTSLLVRSKMYTIK